MVKRFGDFVAVDNVSLSVQRGEIFGFLGSNGAGKTTTIRMLCGLLTPEAGRGTCLGFDVLREQREIRTHVGYMTQRFSFYEDLSVRENLDFVARLYAVPERRRTVEAAIERLGFAGRSHQLAGQLSGGWKQRLALAACLIHSPQLLLLDEPTAGVDPKARREFWGEIHQLAAAGLTVLITTHYMDEAERCHRLGYIAYGNMLARGTVEEVVRGANLTTWEVSGRALAGVAEALRGREGVEQVVPFGNTLHVTGREPARLEAAIAPWRQNPGLAWKQIPSGLEDVFISLMGSTSEQMR